MAVEPEKHEDGLDKDGNEPGKLRNQFGDVCCSRFRYYHSLTKAIFK